MSQIGGFLILAGIMGAILTAVDRVLVILAWVPAVFGPTGQYVFYGVIVAIGIGLIVADRNSGD